MSQNVAHFWLQRCGIPQNLEKCAAELGEIFRGKMVALVICLKDITLGLSSVPYIMHFVLIINVNINMQLWA